MVVLKCLPIRLRSVIFSSSCFYIVSYSYNGALASIKLQDNLQDNLEIGCVDSLE